MFRPYFALSINYVFHGLTCRSVCLNLFVLDQNGSAMYRRDYWDAPAVGCVTGVINCREIMFRAHDH